ncbi:MAG: hypothetical protein VW665_07825 [Candidatus Puniceispirillum sp.]
MDDNAIIIKDKSQLVEWLAAGAKSRKDWRIGTEHEKFMFHSEDLSSVAYDGNSGIGAVLWGLCAKIGDAATPIMEAGKIIGLKDGVGG